MRRLIALTGSMVLLASVAIAPETLATPASGVESKTLATGHLPPVSALTDTVPWQALLWTNTDSTLTVVENDVAPGGTFGWHSHPGPSLVVVVSGTLTFYDGDDPNCTPMTKTAGDAFVDPGDHVHMGVNKGTDPAVVLVTRLTPTDAKSARIDEDAPAQCADI
jgi:quercetin dioxygenase-like cupin family protein